MKEFQVKSKLLHAAIWGGTGCYQWDGYTNADKGDFGRALIEYFAARLFSIHRLPGYEPNYTHGSQIGFMQKFGLLPRDEFENAYKEFEELYKHTQNELKSSGLVVNGKIRLNRSLRNFETAEILPQILNGDMEIEFPSNIITSYAHDGRLYDYSSWMSIVRDVPIELVVMYNECLYHPPGVCAYLQHGGESEVWVVEKDVFGYTKLPQTCFKYEEIPEEVLREAKGKQSEFSYNKRAKIQEGSLFSCSALRILPCEQSRIMNYFIKKEVGKISEQYNIH